MFHPRRFRAGSRTTFASALGLLLLFVAHSAPVPSNAARRARAEEQLSQLSSVPPGEAYRNRHLVSSIPGLAYVQDPFVVSPWGVSLLGGLTAVDATTHTALRYTIFIEPQDFHLGTIARGVPPITLPGGTPTGVVQSVGTSFPFIVAVTAAGEVVGWNLNQGSDVGQVLASQPGHVYTGVASAEANVTGSNAHYLYAADFANGKIDVFNTSYVLQTSGFAFSDPTVPADFHPYNIQSLGGALYVTYAKVGPGNQALTGAGLGYLRIFNTNGTLSNFFKLDGGQLNAPWGVTISSSQFGTHSNRVLVANTGDGTICVFDFSGNFIARLQNEAGQPIVIEGLRAVTMAQSPSSPPGTYTVFYSSDHGLLGSLEPTTATATSLVQLAAASLSAGEGLGHIDITATRSGDVSGAASVNYAAFDRPKPGRASQKSDYEAAAGTLNFAPGETSKTFRVFIVNDNLVEGDERVSLALSNPSGTGVGLGSPYTAEITILDNDTTAPTTNPVDDSSFFVRQHYLDFLNREPDPGGLQFWVNEIESCGADAQCREVKRVNVSAAFFLSIEFQRTGLLAYLTHRAVFGTRPSYGAFVRDVQPLQQNLVFGQPGFDAQLEANKQAYFNGFVQRTDYLRNAPGGVTPAEFVDRLYERAGVTPTTAERDAAIAEFGGASGTGDSAAQARVLRRVAETPAFAQAEFNRAFVAMEYFGYLRRDPDESGYQFWLDKLNQFNGNFIQAEMVKAFITSAEYRQRFGP